MSIFGSKKKLIAVYDVGSASVGSALVEVCPDKKPFVLETMRKDISIQEEINHKRFFETMLSAFEDVCLSCKAEKGRESADEVVCFFSSPWYAALYGQVRIVKKENFSVTNEMVEGAINEKVTKFEKSVEEKYQGDELGVPKLVEKINMRVRLNGYETEKYEGKDVMEFESDFFASVIPDKVLSGIKDRVFKRFNDREISFHTTPIASYVAIRENLCGPDGSFMSLDITGEMTDVLWVREGVIQKGASFPIGRNFMLRKLAENLRVDVGGVDTLLLLYQSGKSENATRETIEKTLDDCRNVWMGELKESIRRFSRGGIAPRSVFFVCDDRFSEWFQKILEEDFYPDSGRETEARNGPHAYFLGGRVLEKMCDFQKGAKKDAFLALEATFLTHCL